MCCRESRQKLDLQLQQWIQWHTHTYIPGYTPPETLTGSLVYSPLNQDISSGNTTVSRPIPPPQVPQEQQHTIQNTTSTHHHHHQLYIYEDRPSAPSKPASHTVWFNIQYEKTGDVPSYIRASTVPLVASSSHHGICGINGGGGLLKSTGIQFDSGGIQQHQYQQQKTTPDDNDENNNHRYRQQKQRQEGKDITVHTALPTTTTLLLASKANNNNNDDTTQPTLLITPTKQYNNQNLASQCFNCGSYGHSLHECFREVDPERVELRKLAFLGVRNPRALGNDTNDRGRVAGTRYSARSKNLELCGGMHIQQQRYFAIDDRWTTDKPSTGMHDEHAITREMVRADNGTGSIEGWFGKVPATAKSKKKETLNMRFVPGVLSPDLRQALGIGPRDPPPWLHAMRALGIPPAYHRRNLNRQRVIEKMEGGRTYSENGCSEDAITTGSSSMSNASRSETKSIGGYSSLSKEEGELDGLDGLDELDEDDYLGSDMSTSSSASENGDGMTGNASTIPATFDDAQEHKNPQQLDHVFVPTATMMSNSSTGIITNQVNNNIHQHSDDKNKDIDGFCMLQASKLQQQNDKLLDIIAIKTIKVQKGIATKKSKKRRMPYIFPGINAPIPPNAEPALWSGKGQIQQWIMPPPTMHLPQH